MTLTLRPYQEQTLDALREGFAQGKRTQILYAPTGAGKTEMAIALLHATKTKGNKAAMLLDRIILCDQTSKRLDKYQIDHGVHQAGHWRNRPSENIQVCSAQTLERRGAFPGLNLLIVDEAHQSRAKTIEYIKQNPDVRVIGLTATPFTQGLGKVYKNVVSTVTTQQLVDQKVLVPLKVFVAKQINMEGAKKIAGEWSSAEVETRGMVITGDIISEWIKKTHEIFGKPEKTIIFCAGVAHGADLMRKFEEQGYRFIAISYKDTDQFKKDVIEEFSKPDTQINGLIATDILTKGFDVPDVRIGISARPFSKSLSSHIQQMGRIMRGYPGKEFAVWLDHSGNYLRFRQDWEDVYTNGVQSLDDGKEKTKPEPTQREKENSVCPRCHFLWSDDYCSNCGYVREKRNTVVNVPGEMTELQQKNVGDPQKWWSQLQWYVKHKNWSPGRAAHTFRERFGTWPKGLMDTVELPTQEVDRFIKKRLREYINKIKRGK